MNETNATVDFRTCSLLERVQALQERAVPLSFSGRVEPACDVVVNLTGSPVRLEISGGLLAIDIPEHGTARDLPLRPSAEWANEDGPRVFFLLGPADRAPGRPDILQVDSGGRVTCQGSPPALWVTQRFERGED